ncbi:FecR domain-containing protein [Mucilaginibacter sabulilitoris]|uniref:FecR domain-containing protein n=1 Tax=Mucilaginibacter sabulilitoris TaxID=1173583 RepID=A0ABZ0TNI6_9SPHI|nr:FecR domain-containing protein [Mucilaginibacter sabulilitoris]WPU94351.1 FecR domain-containing protein [Mucilaginibacter sabulilitoris]
MMEWRKPASGNKTGEDHLQDEEAMLAVEKEMLCNIHKEIFGKWYFIKTTAAKYTMAASLLLMCCASFFYARFSKTDINRITVVVKKGNIKMVTLPDGSTVWLNSGSIIKFPEQFGKTREIQLINGEAYFDVKHDSHSPFIVHYGHLHARVLGTAFNIKSYKNIHDVRLTVTRGRVEVGNKAASFGVLTLDKEIIFDQKKGTHRIRTVDAEKIAAWRSNEINLYNVPFDELIMRLESIYGIHVNYDQTNTNHLTATIHFTGGNTLQYVLEIIKTIYHLNYDIKGKEVYLKKS